MNQTEWQPIDTAPHDPDEPVFLARFRPFAVFPDYAVMGCWGTAMNGFIQCAAYSGWFVDGIPLNTPPSRQIVITFGALATGEYAPTHWQPMRGRRLTIDNPT